MRPTEPANSTSPEKRWPSAKNARCAGEWPGHERDRERDAGDLDRFAALEPDVRRRAADQDPRRRERGGLLDQEPLAGRRVDGRAGLLGEVGEADDVVEVAVGDEDRGAAGAGRRERAPDRGCIAARVDHDRLRRRRRRADEIGVRPDRPELELVDLEAHRGASLYAPLARRFCVWRHTTRSMK